MTEGREPASSLENTRGDRGNAASQSSSSGSKRRRIALACSSCRTRKTRCDGRRPECTPCVEMDFECTYASTTNSVNLIVGRDYLSELQDRVSNLERSFQSSQSVPNPHGNGIARLDRSRHNNDSDNNFPETCTSDGEDGVDAMGAVLFIDEEESGFFGPSSNIALLRRISQAAAGASTVLFFSPNASTDTDPHFRSGIVSFSRSNSPRERGRRASKEIDLYHLPPEQEARELFTSYFTNTGYLFPYVHEKSFMATYNEIKDQQKPTVRRTWLGLLNMIFAIAITTKVDSDIGANRRLEESEVYHQRAVRLCQPQMLRGTSLEIVQYLLISGQYLQGTQKAIEAWAVHGLAVRAAMQLGLHSSESSRFLAPFECEVRKRVWFGCVILDRSMSMTFGRPSAIPESYVKIELPEPYPEISFWENITSAESLNPANVVFYSVTMYLVPIPSIIQSNPNSKMYRIMWSIIDSLYGQNLACGEEPSTTDIISQVYPIEQRLLEWKISLPPSLRIISPPIGPSDADLSPHSIQGGQEQKLTTILTLRYLNLRLLLHRPILVKLLDYQHSLRDGESEAKLLHQVGISSVAQCSESATQIISIVHSAMKRPEEREFLGAWWFTLYYVFNAALISFGCYFVCRPRSGITIPYVCITPSDAAKSLKQAMEALTLLDRGNRMVERCRHYLQTLNTVLSAIEPAGEGEAASTAHFASNDNTLNNLVPVLGPDSDPIFPDSSFQFGLSYGELMNFNF